MAETWKTYVDGRWVIKYFKGLYVQNYLILNT